MIFVDTFDESTSNTKTSLGFQNMNMFSTFVCKMGSMDVPLTGHCFYSNLSFLLLNLQQTFFIHNDSPIYILIYLYPNIILYTL